MLESKCSHQYVFLRQDKRNAGYDRNPVWVIEDVFFCERCLEYRRVDVERHTPRSDSFDMHVRRLV